MRIKLPFSKSLLLASLIGVFTLASCSTTFDPAVAYKNETSTQIFDQGEKNLRDKSYSNAIKRFEALDVQYPFGHETETAQLHLIYAYYMSSDYPSAEAAATRFIHAHPTNPHLAYVYYLRGLSSFYQNLGVFERLFAIDLATRDLSQVQQAYGDFQTIVETYPHSPYAAAAYQYTVYLRNLLANHEYEVAQYYFSRHAYIAAANRANNVVQHYQGAPAVPKALILMARSYRAMHLVQNEQDVMRILEINYPNSNILKEAFQPH